MSGTYSRSYSHPLSSARAMVRLFVLISAVLAKTEEPDPLSNTPKTTGHVHAFINLLAPKIFHVKQQHQPPTIHTNWDCQGLPWG